MEPNPTFFDKGDAIMNKLPHQIILRALAAAIIVGLVLSLELIAAPQVVQQQDTKGLSIVVRTPLHLTSDESIEALVKRFAERGVQRVWVQMKQDETDEFIAGSLFYPSDRAPVAAGFEDNRLGRFIEALAAHDIEPLAWLPVLHDRRAWEMHPDWRAVTIAEDGKTVVQEDWLCPNHPEVAQYQAEIAREVVQRFPALKGLYLDFIRYDDDFSCACPLCLAELAERANWQERMGRPLEPGDLRRAAEKDSRLWQTWIGMRAEKIVSVVDTIRDAVDEARPDFHMGAFVLPFSSDYYELNTQSGQDLERMSQAGLDEIVLMAYWDDWELSPWWVRRSLETADELVGDNADLSFVLDGDMGVRRTRLTLEALGDWASDASWFHYGHWSDSEFDRLQRAVDGFYHEGPMPKPDQVSVVIRIDTEPDYQPSYDAVKPEMIETLLKLFAEEKVQATFITVGKLAELQPDILRQAVEQGHEIGSHAYNHEQIDSLALDKQIAAVDHGLDALSDLGFQVYGFGAPRNSITDEARDRLMEWNLEYDGSAAYDPLTSFMDVQYVGHSQGKQARILVLPFIMPNDWDARYEAGISAPEMLKAWQQRLDRVIELGEPVFVLDIHQWSASQPDNLTALRDFIHYVKSRPECRLVTLREAARHAREVLDRYELPAPTSGDQEPPLPAPQVQFVTGVQ
jgi:peptidoglycan/xylan/chitin deacetylase (PgdA/CDA1 family)/uncharacterized lipoprotein YddW (UPF0748 family)